MESPVTLIAALRYAVAGCRADARETVAELTTNDLDEAAPALEMLLAEVRQERAARKRVMVHHG